MYLRNISLTNFRKFGSVEGDKPAITVEFNPNFNIIVGENDSGKTAIIDAIRYLLGSISDDYERVKPEDFFRKLDDEHSEYFYIEGIFGDLTDKEAGSFLEWLSFNNEHEYELRVSLRVEKKKNENGQEYIDRKVQAGEKVFESRLSSQAKEFLKTTYLKPLRDASNELKPGFRSRLAHILKAHEAFKKSEDYLDHQLVITMQEANEKVENFFQEEYKEGRSLVKDLELLLSDFHDVADQSKSRSKFSVSQTDLTSILKRLSLDTEDINLGLGNLNLLFIATELLLLKDDIDDKVIGPQITFIEEIEAHLHTQAQIRLIKYLEKELERKKKKNQYILTSHSTNLVASVDPRNIIFINNQIAYPLKEEYTQLEHEDYAFLERFLDSTKSNLFFAKGIIFVEGDSEMLLLPVLANLIDYPLHKNGVSLVNVNGTSFERYIKLFSRSNLWKRTMNRPSINTPISIITDLDVKPWIYYEVEDKSKSVYSLVDDLELNKVLGVCEEQRDNVVTEHMGLEYSTLNKLASGFGFTLTADNKNEIESIAKKDISSKFITSLELEKSSSLNKKYSIYDANLSVCVAPNWTLEYSLALSSLAPLLLESIQEARYKNPYEGKKGEIFNELKESSIKNPEDPKIAYKIFKPINDKLVSKAEVAQRLAIKLSSAAKDAKLRLEMRNRLIHDNKLEYLLRAIMHSSSFTSTSKISEEVER
ncbi:ATP-dependent nuclease [Terribacillus saccharophilus]|uniref:ATP-dependent nuclease n=1 Tax=Terribacillus saccharophilus TaxID=361277 RepID=UPI002DC1298D|nr:AAA family ATPase [Terribacillus saccharophilus]